MIEKQPQSYQNTEGRTADPQTIPVTQRSARTWLADLNIRLKIITPFLILTLIVASVGIYIGINLMSQSLDQRLNDYAREAGTVVSNILVQQEVKHQNTTRAIAYTEGFATALKNNAAMSATNLALPTVQSDQTELLLAISATGQLLVHVRYEDEQTFSVAEPLDLEFAGIINDLITHPPEAYVEYRAIARYPLNQRYYYFTIIAIHSKVDGFVGLIVTGTSMDTLLPRFKRNALADITLYLNAGEAIASTLPLVHSAISETQILETLRLDPITYQARLDKPRTSELKTLDVGGREYRLATGALYVGKDILGVFSVALPTDLVTETGTDNRNTYIIIFIVITVGIIVLGTVIAYSIALPVQRLTDTSQAVTRGELDRRAELTSNDEIGQLGRNFDTMTAKLAQRNYDLQKLLSENRAILTSIGDGVALVDLDDHITPSNQAAKTILAEMSQTDADLTPLRNLIGAQSQTETGLEENLWQQEHRRLQVGEKVITVHSAAVRTTTDEYLGTVVVLRDVTVEVEAQRNKDAFVEHVSHELRTPLTPIKGYSALLLATTKDVLSDQQRQFLETIAEKTEVLIEMVNALLDFSEMQASGRLGLRTQTVEFRGILDKLEQEWRPKFEDKALTFTVTCAPNIPATIEVDGNRLRWAMMNLIKNAHNYTDSGDIALDLSMSDNHHLIMTVSDTGIGISPENQDHIFTGFSRVMNIDDDRIRGMGLGLYVSKAIIEAHGGTITVNSELNQGSTFIIDLPTSHTELAAEIE